MPIAELNKDTYHQLSRQIVEELQELAKEQGISFQVAGGSLNGPTEMVMKVRITVSDGKSAVETAKSKWDIYANAFGLKPEHFGKVFQFRGKPVVICGILPNSPKNPIQGRTHTGKVYIFSVDQILYGMRNTLSPLVEVPELVR
jgi:hypothetical protein